MQQRFISFDWPNLSRMNIERARSLMKEKKIDLLVCNGMENVRYLMAWSPFNAMPMTKTHLAVLPVDAEQPVLFTLNYYPDYLRESAPWIKDVRIFSMDMAADVTNFIKDNNIRNARIAYDSFVGFTEGSNLAKQIEEFGCEVVKEEIMMRARTIKSPLEMEVIREASAIAEMGMKEGLDCCIEGWREYEVAAAAEYAMRSAGAEAPAFSAIVASGYNGAIVKETSSDKRLRNGETVMIDQGALFEGYNSEYCRTGIVGKASNVQKEAYRVVLEAEQAAIEALVPGAKAEDVDKAARTVIEKHGWGEYQNAYAVGHGLGIACWELPGIFPGSADIIEAGMFVAVEPGIHKIGLGGIRIEDNIYVTESGPEVLTKTEYWDI
jgi:Xaa-Pro dipeptidase